MDEIISKAIHVLHCTAPALQRPFAAVQCCLLQSSPAEVGFNLVVLVCYPSQIE